ncbi:MAG: carboxylesterase [Actinomycetota bacterium]|nr:carboxylesterase [Actinomycetota bacterium]
MSRRTGVLFLHGFTGSPRTMLPVSMAVDLAGFDVSVPCLPGHGTVVEDMLDTTWADWSATAEAAYDVLAAAHDRVVVVGLSMGGTLAAWLASRHPEIDGAVFVNPMVLPVDPLVQDMVREMIAVGEVYAPRTGTGASDIADPDADERAYAETPLRPVLTLFEAVDRLQPDLPKITCQVLLMTSTQDHVVDPAASDLLAERVSGPVERVTLENSYHVATHDYDKQLVIDRTLAFIRSVDAG